eukprot:7889918-Alexandrium_andersonii.AAC.1
MLTLLQPVERAIKDYWDATFSVDSPLLFLEAVAACALAAPQQVFVQQSVNQYPRTLVFSMTDQSSE